MAPVEKRLDTIERLLRDLLKEKKVQKETWVKATTIMEITKWKNKGSLRRARDNNFVKVKRENGTVWYSVESIADVFRTDKIALQTS